MKIQFNTGNNIHASQKLTEPLIALIDDGLSRYSHQITRVEAHLTDVDGNKDGPNDKRCMLEARVEGRPPIAVTNTADTHEQAVNGAVDKLMASLDTIIGRLSNR